MIRAGRFELPASPTRTLRSTKLSYIPKTAERGGWSATVTRGVSGNPAHFMSEYRQLKLPCFRLLMPFLAKIFNGASSTKQLKWPEDRLWNLPPHRHLT